MSKDPLGNLAQSLQDENAAVEDRFERAGRILGGKKRPLRKKTLVVRDTFSFPDFDYVFLSELQQRCLRNGHYASKSELVRAGLKAMMQMESDDLLKTVQAVEKLKPGRVGGSR